MVKQGNKILFFFFFVWAIVCSTPKLGSPQNHVVLFTLAFVILIVHYTTIARWMPLVLSVVAYIFLVFFYKLLGISSAEWGNYMNQMAFFLPIMLMVLIPEKLSDNQIKTLWWLIVLVGVFNIADNIRLCILYPQLNNVSRYRLLQREEELMASINAGGTTFFTFSLLFFNSCFFVFLNSKEKSHKYMALAASLISAIYILGYCLKGSVVVYFLLSLVLQYYAYRTKNSTLFVLVLIFIAFIGFLVLYLFKEAVVDFIVKISPSDRLTVRLITLVDADNEAANIKTITGRTDLYMLSLDTWVSNFGNFFFGIGDHRVMRGARATGIGQHADLLDSLARYGVMGLVILFSVFKYVFKFILSLFDKKYKLQLIAIFVIFMMCGLTKGLFYPGIGCAMFVLLPLSKEFVKQK